MIFLKTIHLEDFKVSSWKPVQAEISQDSILGPLLFLIYINDLPNELKTNVKLFVDDISLFNNVKDTNESANALTIIFH